MAIAFKGHVTGQATNGNNATLNLASPTSGSAPSAGDVVLAVSCSFGRAGNEGRIGNALSYAPVNDFNSATRRHRVAWKAWVSGENSITVEGSANSADAMAASAIWFSGVDTVNPFSTTNTTATGTSTNPNAAAIVPADNNCAIVVLAGSSNTDAAPGTLTSYTVLASIASNDTNQNTVNIAYRILSGGSGVSQDPAAYNAWITGDWGVVTAALQEASVVSSPFYQTVWPVPPRARQLVKDWVFSLSPALTAILPDTENLPAGVTNWFNPWGRRPPVQDWSWPSLRPIPVALTAEGGSYTITGATAVFAFGQAADAGSYTASGTAASLAFGHVAGAGAYNISGSAAAIGGVEEDYAPGWSEWFNPWRAPYPAALRTWIVGPTPTPVSYVTRPPLITRIWASPPRDYWIWSVAYQVGETVSAAAGAYALTGSDAQLTVSGTITLACEAGSYNLTGSDITFVGVEVTPPEISPPLPGGVGGRPRYRKHPLKQKRKRKRKRDECEELLEYLRSLPPAQAQAAIDVLPPSSLSLLDGIPLPHAITLPPSIDDDEDECALLLEMLLS